MKSSRSFFNRKTIRAINPHFKSLKAIDLCMFSMALCELNRTKKFLSQILKEFSLITQM